jgi:xylulokinase
MTHFLGLDCSTQSLTALVLDWHGKEVVHLASLRYDEELPHFETRNGVLPHADPTVVHAPPLMWVEALDRLLARLSTEGLDLGSVAAVAGCAQQHGSVYLTGEAAAALAGLDPSRPLAEGLDRIFARASAPVWMDSSTGSECAEIRRALGGPRGAAEATGSDVYERFTAPQIRRFARLEPASWERTTHVHLVSSFMASLLAGRLAPLDPGDGAGTNLMDIRALAWHPEAVAATASELGRRLPSIVPSGTILGPISSYFVARHGLRPDARVLVWTGDNPSSMVGTGLVEPALAAVSLGTSDTYFVATPEARIDAEAQGHVFAAPSGGYLSLLCFRNGSLARQRVRDRYGLDWEGFSDALAATPPGNDGKLMLPWFEPEIVPRVAQPGLRRFGGLDEGDAAGNCRAVVEGQALAMRLHSAFTGEAPSRLVLTGGGSENRQILQVFADVFGCEVAPSPVSQSAALGSALRAAHAWLALVGEPASWAELVRGFTDPAPDAILAPRAEATRVYEEMLPRYAACERQALATG